MDCRSSCLAVFNHMLLFMCELTGGLSYFIKMPPLVQKRKEKDGALYLFVATYCTLDSTVTVIVAHSLSTIQIVSLQNVVGLLTITSITLVKARVI